MGIVGRTSALIIVGVDSSPTSWDAFDWAIGEAARLHGKLVTVHVQPALEPLIASAAAFAYAAARQAADELAEQLCHEADRRALEAGVQITFIREIGDIAVVLADIAHSLKADLIVVGKSTKKVRYLAGSIGRRLITSRDTPAIVVVP